MSMLRLRRKLQPRVSNTLAAFTLLLLLVSSFAQKGESVQAENRQANPAMASRQASAEEESFTALQAATRQTIKISLMLFHHN